MIKIESLNSVLKIDAYSNAPPAVAIISSRYKKALLYPLDKKIFLMTPSLMAI